jgi:hypothetical protein
MRKRDSKGIHMVEGQRHNHAMSSEAAGIEIRAGSVEFVLQGRLNKLLLTKCPNDRFSVIVSLIPACRRYSESPEIHC